MAPGTTGSPVPLPFWQGPNLPDYLWESTPGTSPPVPLTFTRLQRPPALPRAVTTPQPPPELGLREALLLPSSSEKQLRAAGKGRWLHPPQSPVEERLRMGRWAPLCVRTPNRAVRSALGAWVARRHRKKGREGCQVEFFRQTHPHPEKQPPFCVCVINKTVIMMKSLSTWSTFLIEK